MAAMHGDPEMLHVDYAGMPGLATKESESVANDNRSYLSWLQEVEADIKRGVPHETKEQTKGRLQNLSHIHVLMRGISSTGMNENFNRTARPGQLVPEATAVPETPLAPPPKPADK
jgi:hypothetical protein